MDDAPAPDVDVLLADGTTARLRPITPDDADALRAFHARLSQETIVLRFFGPHPRLSDTEVARFTHVDGTDRVALVAERGGELVAVARYDRSPGSDEAEVAFVVDDRFQGRGLGTILLEHLAAAARPRGVRRFVADTLSENHRMLRVFRDAGFARQFSRDSEVMRVVLDIAPSAAARIAADERDRLAVLHSMQRLLRPSSVAVIGASPRPGTVGHRLVANLLDAAFTGPVYPVHPEASSVAGVPAWPTVEEVPGPVDLAVVAVPAEAVPAVVAACGRKGVGGLVVVSAGFAETGEEGEALQRRVVRDAHALGMRMVGPNCFGVLNTDPGVSLNATLAPEPAVAGTVGFASQSGGLAVAILAEAATRGLGLSSFVSLGNKADVSGNDTLVWFEDDPATAVVLLYLESFGNPRRFSRIARRVSRVKPVLAVKSGRSASGARGATSHTAAPAGSDEAVDALLRATGVVRVDTIEELFEAASVLALQPLPRGDRVAVLGNVGGPGVLGADACIGHGLAVPELSARTQSALAAHLGPGAGVTNPVDLGAAATP
ncbi:MAG TPA: GNAT family N-acetyltransferase, partial [Acidimicrobiales bacterium]|nr:GNAT family N-acetyltransferase [Acidimicrobiales bacterium]